MEISYVITLVCCVSMLAIFVGLYIDEFNKNQKLNRQIKQQKRNKENVVYQLNNFIGYLQDKQISELLGAIGCELKDRLSCIVDILVKSNSKE